MSPATRTWAMVAFVALLGVAAFLVSRAWPVLFPDREQLPVDPACDLRAGPCSRVLPDGTRLAFTIRPRSLPLMQPLALEVELAGSEVAEVQVDIVGLNMNMGPNRTRLEPVGAGRWRGTTLLPVCSARVMQWEAAVWLSRGGRILAIPHRFETRRSGT